MRPATLRDMNQQIADPAPPSQPAPPARHFAATLTSTRRGARLARLLETQQLDAWGHPYAVTPRTPPPSSSPSWAANAVRHAALPGHNFHLALSRRRPRSRNPPHRALRRPRREATPAPPAPESTSGRGLLLVENVATCWGVADRDPIGKTVWVELDILVRGDRPGVHPSKDC